MPDINGSVIETRSPHIASRQPDIEAELINTLYQQGNTALIGVTVTSTAIAVIFYNEISNLITGLWLMGIYSLSFIRFLSIKKFKSQRRPAEDIIYWGWKFVFFVFLSGLSWAAASIIFFTADNPLLFNVLTIIIIAMSVGSLAALSALPKAYYSFVIPAMLPIIWRYLNIDAVNYHIFGLLLFVFNFALFSIIRVNHRILKESVVLRFKNLDLIKQLTEQKEKAEQANISKTKFLAAASHDMRQPIHAIGLFLGVLEDRISVDEQKRIVHKTQKSCQALNGLLDSLLDISKLDAGVIPVEPGYFCLQNLFNALENEFKSDANERNLSLRFVSTRFCVNTDYRILETITRNLISNAIRYTSKGGVLVACRRHKGQGLLVVYDTGIGIHNDNLQDIFTEFHQLHNPERDRSKGLGLGLAIVQRMSQLLDMPLHIKSVPGKGSSFGVVMSVTTGAVEKTRYIKSSDKVFFDARHVLVVDDEESVRDSLCELLVNWRFQVVSATSGKDAVLALELHHSRPDIILVDYRLRDNETGLQVINKVNSLYPEADSEIPAIIVTGDTAPECIKEVESSGYKILHKPVSPDILRSLLAELIYTKL